MTKVIWLSFSPSKTRLKNPNTEQIQSDSLAFGICKASKASEASIRELAKARGCFEGSRQHILSCRKSIPLQILNETIWPLKLLPANMTKYKFSRFLAIPL